MRPIKRACIIRCSNDVLRLALNLPVTAEIRAVWQDPEIPGVFNVSVYHPKAPEVQECACLPVLTVKDLK